MVVVSQHCTSCGDNAFSWRSQPLIFGKYPAGNMLLSFGVLMAGASISKVLLVMRHMGLCAYSARTFFVHQKNFLFPVILNHWEEYRASLVGKLKNMTNVVWSGDGRFDSMGHSAKYGAYTMFCNTILKVVHFELLQVSGNISINQGNKRLKLFFLRKKNMTSESSIQFYIDCSPSTCIKLKKYVGSSTHLIVLGVLSIKISGSGYLNETIGL